MDDSNAEAEWAAEMAKEEADRLRKSEPPPALSAAEFLAWRAPRVVHHGPVPLDNPLWHWLVRTRWSAFRANEMFNGPSPFRDGPMWCFDRYGMSQTRLPDGRVVHIGGEHEDHYDPDFFIYNDVTVIGPGAAISIHGYPRPDFPPTDFHSATLAGESIVIIGRLGYPGERVVGATPVYRLSVDTLAIAAMDTFGQGPGWIHKHAARLTPDGHAVVVSGGTVWLGDGRSMQENLDTWSLDLSSGRWTRTIHADWQRWTMLRVDRKPNRLWDVRQALWHRDNAWAGLEDSWRFDDPPDLEALSRLYRLDDDSPPPTKGDDYDVFRVVVDGVTVRFTEGRFEVHAIVEGRLDTKRLAGLQRHTLAMLAQLDGSDWEIEAS